MSGSALSAAVATGDVKDFSVGRWRGVAIEEDGTGRLGEFAGSKAKGFLLVHKSGVLHCNVVVSADVILRGDLKGVLKGERNGFDSV